MSTSGGWRSLQMSSAQEQRGWNRQPTGRLVSEGGCPSIEYSRLSFRSSRGTELIRAIVYGCLGALNSSLVEAFSTNLPAYITPTLWQSSATTPKSWVIKIMAIFVFC